MTTRLRRSLDRIQRIVDEKDNRFANGALSSVP